MTPKEFLKREEEIQLARAAYPGMELGAAFRRWKTLRGEQADLLKTNDPSIEKVKTSLKESAKKPCTQPDCKGEMLLESVCGGCVEGRRGYRSKWTCQECLHRELSKKEYMEWLRELSLV